MLFFLRKKFEGSEYGGTCEPRYVSNFFFQIKYFQNFTNDIQID